MKVMSILGSPRKNGNTAKALRWVEEEIRAKGHRVNRVDIVDFKVSGCIECYQCQEVADRPGCAQEDDGNSLLERMISSDAVLMASPLFCWEFSAQIKPLIDRGFSLVTDFGTPKHRSLLEGKRIALLVTAAGPEEENTDLICQAFLRYSRYLKCEVLEPLVLPLCTTPDAMGREVEEKARRLGRKIVS